MIHAQYVKDLSFENPNAPHTLKTGRGGPDMDVNINLTAKEIEDESMSDLYEVTLMLSATAKKEDTVYFIAEIEYGALVSLKGAPENQHHPMLFIEIPRMMFPFARQILGEVTGNGGFPPLLLNPVDFQGMYIERFAKDLEISQQNGKAA
jgi:preprotein translocase subunit SecB